MSLQTQMACQYLGPDFRRPHILQHDIRTYKDLRKDQNNLFVQLES